MNFFKKLLVSLKTPLTQDVQPTPQPLELREPVTPGSLTESEVVNQAARQASEACLDRHWGSVGTVERDVLSYIISPSFSVGPYWPSTRQAYRVVRRGDSVIIATEGLSDPFDDAEGMGNGFEMELFIETADIPEHARGPLGEVDPFKRSWAFELVEHVAKTVADAGGITHRLEQYGALSLEIPGFSLSHHMSDQLPRLFVTDDDSTGVLLGAPEPDFPTQLDDMPLSPVRLVPVVLITASELEYVRSGGREAREDLVVRLKAAGVGHMSSLHRASVV
ncbi:MULTISPECIES: suppressor of fused domain protein [unclassified Pseudomonas]|uniref:suppressor of fused domain protein n=1 Tax=unclassified Pseudomonas TaxID=196821 RepID=UPI000CD0CF43|nr:MULTISPECIES: suppressor of fused domain protein [unclassified Pseudomonas]POA31762.1 Suppressor of fused protein (SUFU) [Pseudomonas sp. GW456-R21]POA68493.1 Suppressor of fused protein (SUFU) [Pseudomonas sp. GW460-R15]